VESHSKSQLSILVKKLDFVLISIVSAAALVSLIVLYSAANGELFFVKRQLFRLAIATSCMLAITMVPFETIRRHTMTFNIVCILLLIWVITHGHIGKGAQRWIDLGFFRFEPSELCKVAIPLLTARFIANCSTPIKLIDSLFLFGLISVPTVLVLLQPDLGTAIILMTVGVSAIFMAGLSHRIILVSLACAVALLPISWDYLHDYQKLRLINFFYPDNDPLGTGYHILQSKIAIGSGGIFGYGLLSGPQVRLKFIPEHYTDFVFSLIGEEFGLLGTFFVLILFAGLTIRGFMIAWQADDLFTKISIACLTLSITLSSIINISMTMGLLPVVGIPLPLISYGGSSLLTTLMAIGIIQSAKNSQQSQ
tara:strand:+ start:352 stop:1449 length:1098 start_codon:yes stop_codon:yes gene_type:complete